MQLRVSEPRASSCDEAQELCPVESYRRALPGEFLVLTVQSHARANDGAVENESTLFASECKR